MGAKRMTAWEAKHQAQLAEWQERVINCRTSGRTVKAWCEEQGIGYKTYYRWERQILSLGRKTLQQVGQQQLAQIESPVFAEVRMTEQIPVKEGIAAVIRIGRAETAIYNGADPETVEAICRGLGNAK